MEHFKHTSFRRFLVVFVLVAVFFAACTKRIYVPVEHTEYVTVRDSVYFRDTLIRIELEKARLSDFCDVGDTLVLRTDLAQSWATLDTLAGKIVGGLENIKPYAVQNVPLKEKIVYRDSIVYKDVPVPVVEEKIVKVVPWFWRVMSVIGIVALAYLAFRFIVFKK